MTALDVQGLGFRYPTGQGLHAVSFAVPPGALWGLVGPNSAGKSTLLRLLSKVLTPQGGRILVEGRDLRTVGRLALARRLAVVPQELQVAFPFSVLDVVLMGRYPHSPGGSWSARDRAVAWSALEGLGLTSLARRRMDELSGGERQLVSLARALAQEPSILLLDEPTAHLDLRHQRIVLETLLSLHRVQGCTTLLVSHDLNLAAEHCDCLLLLVGGRMQAQGSPEEVMTPTHLERAYGCSVVVERNPASGRPRLTSSLGPSTSDRTTFTSPWS